jgi:hypothetical protein
VIACMGGWCTKRDKCPHYHATTPEPAERLCVPGEDGQLLRNLETGERMAGPIGYRLAHAPEAAA